MLESARKRLDELWKIVHRETNSEINQEIDQFINSRFVSIRFCLLTQLSGKLAAPHLNCLCLQKGGGESNSHWDPRSFAKKVIVPWNAENQYVLGMSTDPYVSKPLRKPHLEENPVNVKGQDEWRLLYQFLHNVESQASEEYTRLCVLYTLRSIYRKFSELSFEYFVPKRISMEQTSNLIGSFLLEASGGDRGLAVAAALFQTFGKYFKIYEKVNRHAINASDQSTGSVADIECIGMDGELKLAIEVKERNLTLMDYRSTVEKARKASLQELLFSSPGIDPSDHQEVHELINKTWASGTNLYRHSIFDLIRVGLSLTGEDGRKDFLENVGKQLDTYNTQPINRRRWKELLEEI